MTGQPVPTEQKGRFGHMPIYDCRSCSEGGRLVRSRQAERGCALPGFDRSTWVPKHVEMVTKAYLGRSDTGFPDEREEPSEGCPGAWARSPFALSFQRYARRRTADGNRVNNPRVGPHTPEFILECLDYYEAEHELATRRYDDEIERMRG